MEKLKDTDIVCPKCRTINDFTHERENYLKCKTCGYEMYGEDQADPLAELEAVALEHYITKGYKVSEDQDKDDKPWHFEVRMQTKQKYKYLEVLLFIGDTAIKDDSYFDESETTKEMFDKAIYYFKK